MNNQNWNYISGLKRFEIKRLDCIVKALAPQGNSLFVIARYPDKTITNSDNTLSTIKGGFVGNEADFPENQLLLSDVLIISDIDMSIYRGITFERFIGKRVKFEILDNRPVRILLKDSMSEARTIPREIIQQIRAASDRDIHSEKAYGHIENAGLTRAEFDALKKEKLEDLDPEGKVLIFGDTADWFRTSKEEAEAKNIFLDISKFIDEKYILGLPLSKLRFKVCYTPPVIFSGAF